MIDTIDPTRAIKFVTWIHEGVCQTLDPQFHFFKALLLQKKEWQAF
jgi:hypothetical protein